MKCPLKLFELLGYPIGTISRKATMIKYNMNGQGGENDYGGRMENSRRK